MANDDERDLLAQALCRLSLPELVDVLRRVLPAHSDRDGVMASKLILAEVVWEQGEVPTPDQRFIEAVAWPDRTCYDGGFGPEPGLYEQGRCSGCSLDVISTAKRANCPLCGGLCLLT
jgi:hypothetical protein